jgi:hypothetical protein
MINPMNDADDLTIECATCPATGTTACGDCIVTHLLANDDGPIEYTPAPHVGHGRSLEDRALSLFAAAGLIDDPPQFASPSEFGDVAPADTGSRSLGRGVAR